MDGPDEAFATPGSMRSVISLAGVTIRSFTDPSIDLRTNILGTLNVLQQCLKHRVSRMLSPVR